MGNYVVAHKLLPQALLFQSKKVTISHSFQGLAGLWKWQLELYRVGLAVQGQQPHPSLCRAVRGRQEGAGGVQALPSCGQDRQGYRREREASGLGLRLNSWFLLALLDRSSSALPKGRGQNRKPFGALGRHLPRAARGNLAVGRI